MKVPLPNQVNVRYGESGKCPILRISIGSLDPNLSLTRQRPFPLTTKKAHVIIRILCIVIGIETVGIENAFAENHSLCLYSL